MVAQLFGTPAVFLAAALTFGQSAPTTQKPGPSDYRIGPEDVLAISVLEAPDLKSTIQVTPSGEISMPLVGTLKVTGLTSTEVEAALAARLREKYIKNPNVSVQVAEAKSSTVSVTGAVKKPGVFQLRSPKRLLEVIALAEGLAEDAGERALIMRGESSAEPVREVTLRALLDSPDAAANLTIHPGDVVKITRQGTVYVVGDVKKPGAFAMGSGKHTVLNVLAQTEGLLPTAAPSKALILRPNANGDRETVPLDLEKVLRGKSPDVPLQAEDVLFVPQSGAKVFGRAAADAALRLLTFRIPFVR